MARSELLLVIRSSPGASYKDHLLLNAMFLVKLTQLIDIEGLMDATLNHFGSLC